MNKAPLLFILALSLGLVGSYLVFFAKSSLYAPPPKCSLDYSEIRFARVISNKQGKVHKVSPAFNGPTNHAYRKLAEQEKTWGGAGVHGAFRATDGDTSGTEDTLTHSEESHEPWVQVDLDEHLPIRTIRVHNRKDEYGSRTVPFTLFISKVPFEKKSLAEARGISEQSMSFVDKKDVFVWNLTEPVVGRYVRVQLEGKNFLHISEIEVFTEYVSDDYVFRANYMTVTAEPPLVLLPSSYASFLEIAAHSINMSSPKRIFTNNGNELTEVGYQGLITGENRIPELYISEGEDFIGDVRVCIVFLCTEGRGYNTNSDYLSEVFMNLEILSANFFTTYQYPVIIFYAWPVERANDNIARFRTKFPYLDIKFVNVAQHFPPDLPQHLKDNKVDMTWFQKGTDCAPGNRWALNYLHMGRFWSTQLWKEPILKNYDLIWRLDADATVDKPTKTNFLRDMWGKHKLFAYWCRFGDTAECDGGIPEATQTFAEKKGLEFKHAEKITPHAAYWGGFGVYASKFFCYDQNWLEYADYLDSLGGHYNHRWGEQNVFPKALSLFLEFDQLYWVQTSQLQIFHDHDPAGNCLGVDNKYAKLITKK